MYRRKPFFDGLFSTGAAQLCETLGPRCLRVSALPVAARPPNCTSSPAECFLDSELGAVLRMAGWGGGGAATAGAPLGRPATATAPASPSPDHTAATTSFGRPAAATTKATSLYDLLCPVPPNPTAGTGPPFPPVPQANWTLPSRPCGWPEWSAGGWATAWPSLLAWVAEQALAPACSPPADIYPAARTAIPYPLNETWTFYALQKPPPAASQQMYDVGVAEARAWAVEVGLA